MLFRSVFLVHPGGPFWAKKDNGAWSIPKGEFEDAENPLDAAQREFSEETGQTAAGEFLELAPIKQPSGKTIVAWAVQGDFDATQIRSNTFTLEWPPKSGQTKEFPEVDKAGWFPLSQAREKLIAGQLGFLEDLMARLKSLNASLESVVVQGAPPSKGGPQGSLF